MSGAALHNIVVADKHSCALSFADILTEIARRIRMLRHMFSLCNSFLKLVKMLIQEYNTTQSNPPTAVPLREPQRFLHNFNTSRSLFIVAHREHNAPTND